MKKSINISKLFIIFIFLISVFCFAVSFFNTEKKSDLVVNAETQIDINTSISNASLFTGSELTNNLILVKFKGETTDYELYQNSFTTFNTMFNTGEISVKEYYKINSNGNLSLTTDIITTNGTDAFIVTLDKERTYYMPYIIRDEDSNGNTKYIYNEDGYFDYYLIQKNSQYSSRYPQFYRDNTLIAKVYEIPEGANLPTDSNYSDKIMSYNEALSLANSTSGYELVEANERYLREYQLLCNALEEVSSYISTENSDVNGDGIFDCFSVGLIDNERVSKYHMDTSMYWGSLLWPHKVENLGLATTQSYSYVKSIGESKCVNYYANFGFDKTDIQTIFDYMENQPTVGGLTFNTIDMANYEVFDIATQSKWNSFVKDITTISHELGHVLGLPDLYVYSTGASTSVGSWSHMCNSHTTYPSFFTSYERAKLNWIDYNNNIQDITQNGIYSLNAVKGYDGTNKIAYRIADPDNPYQYLYLEYRNLSLKYYDTKCGTYPGLIAYTVNTDITDGNKSAPTYEIYVQRPTGTSVYAAALDEGDTLGNSNTSSTTNAILFNVGTSSEKNSGIVIEVIERTDDEIIFKVTSPDLYSATPYTVEDFGGNTALYNKLLSQATTGKLTFDVFENNTSLDLSYTEIDSLLFLSLFEFDSLKYLNLIGNNFTETFDFASYVSEYSLQNVALSFNNVNLKNLAQSYLTNTIYDWGIQYTTDNKVVVNSNFSFMYYFTSLNKISSITVNGTSLGYCTTSSIGEYTVSTLGEHSIKITFGSNNLGLTAISDMITVATISSLYNSSTNCYKLGQNDSFPVVTALMSIKGTNSSNFDFEYTYPATISQKSSYFTIKALYNSKQVAAVNVYYSVIEVKVVYNNDNPVILEIGESYEEKGITVYENNINKNYTQATSGTCTFSIKYYSGTLNSNGSVNIIQETVIDSSTKGSYLVNYTIRTSFDKIYNNYYLPVLVDDDLIKPSKMNEDLYKALTDISQKDYVYKSDFSGLDYIDLSNKNLESIQGLEVLEFKQDVVINLTNNLLNNISELTIVISTNSQIKGIILLFNYYNASDIYGLVNRSKYCFAVQNVSTINLGTSLNNSVADMYNDYSDYFTFDCSSYNQQNSKLYFTATGTYVCSFYSETYLKTYSKTIQNIVITSKEQTIKEYSDTLSFNVNNFFNISGISSNSLSVTSDFSSLELNKIGKKVLTVNFSYGEKSLQLTHFILVKDTIKPVITLNGKTEVYITSYSQYQKLYQNDVCTAYDAYDGNLDVSISVPDMVDYGEYEIIYSTKDSSNNTASLTRKVYYGNVSLLHTDDEQDYNLAFSIPFKFDVFTQEQFSISYKQQEEAIFNDYNGQIILNEFGKKIIELRLIHKKNADILYMLEYSVTIKDKDAPHIQLDGGLRLNIFAGAEYKENGYTITDNGTDDIVTLNNTSSDITLFITYMFKPLGEEQYQNAQELDTTQVGEYIIEYTAVDLYNNEATKERVVEVSYAPIEQIEIDQSKILSKYSTGQNLTLTVNSISDYITEPNPVIVWYVNDEVYTQTQGTSVEIKFDKAGEYLIYAKILDSDTAYSQDLIITIYQPSPFEGPLLYVIIALSVAIVAVVVVSLISRYRKRNFY